MNGLNGLPRDQAQSLRELVQKHSKEILTAERLSGAHNEGHIKIVTVASGKGGVGKSTLSVNLAIALSKLGIRTLVIDADFGLANVDLMLGVNARYNLSHLLNGEKNLDEIIQQGHMGVRFISGGSGMYELLNLDERQLQTIVSGLKHLDDPAELILLDCGAGVGDNVMQLVMESQETIVVSTPEPTAILDAYALIKTVLNRDREHPIRLLMNKCDNQREAETAISGLKKVINSHLGVQVEALGYILYDGEVTRAIKQMTPIVISHPNGVTARELSAIAKTLMNLPQHPARKSLLTRFFSRFMGVGR